ncbi:hypothetical protein [Oceanicoccus sagamiensis]|uniref:Uncharacterized protein n=1 Tax=Oceanicoccus sagamiensis TaxID=716816 RepID=A0A1X9NL53_9GAMM|nr:hypothetical protein [Oceanicoccus sagamiensis]ARN76149.1 hypothetical protein BST96_19825 [Oceanicoccus sagamiensis]
MTDFPELDFHDFHLQELPRRLAAGHGLLAAIAARELPALCFRLTDTDNAYTFQPMPETIAIIAGTEAEQVVELDHLQWQGLIYNLKSTSGCLSIDDSCHSEDVSAMLKRWELVLAAMFYGNHKTAI